VTRNVASRQQKKIIKASLWWPIIYVFGLILVLVAITSLVKENWNVEAVQVITYSFVGIGGIGMLGFAFIFPFLFKARIENVGNVVAQ
jgi:polyferredoxin